MLSRPTTLAEQRKAKKHKARQMPGFVHLLYDRLYCFRSQSETTLGQRFAISSIPTLVLFIGGREVQRQVGAIDATSIRRWLAQGLAAGVSVWPWLLLRVRRAVVFLFGINIAILHRLQYSGVRRAQCVLITFSTGCTAP